MRVINVQISVIALSKLLRVFSHFLPDIPVIEMPKWPDIVIDVSNIEAGVNLIWRI